MLVRGGGQLTTADCHQKQVLRSFLQHKEAYLSRRSSRLSVAEAASASLANNVARLKLHGGPCVCRDCCCELSSNGSSSETSREGADICP